MLVCILLSVINLIQKTVYKTKIEHIFKDIIMGKCGVWFLEKHTKSKTNIIIF